MPELLDTIASDFRGWCKSTLKRLYASRGGAARNFRVAVEPLLRQQPATPEACTSTAREISAVAGEQCYKHPLAQHVAKRAARWAVALERLGDGSPADPSSAVDRILRGEFRLLDATRSVAEWRDETATVR